MYCVYNFFFQNSILSFENSVDPDQQAADKDPLFLAILSHRSSSIVWEHSGSVVECLTPDRGAVGSSLKGVTVLCR